jgi:benzaldehyde dehydrogenase (NAD)
MLSFDPEKVSLPTGHYIGGQHVQGQGALSEVKRPSDGRAYAQLRDATPEDVDHAVTVAHQALKTSGWSGCAPRERGRVLRRWADLIEQDPLLAQLEALGSTRPISDVVQHEIPFTAEAIRFYAECADKYSGDLFPTRDSSLGMLIAEPYGVIGAITPWNFPLSMASWKCGPALAAGNAVVLKPDPQTPVSGGFLIARLFEAAGLPKGLLQVLPGAADAGEALCRDPNVKMIAFTGSTGAGRKVAEVAGRNLKKVALELGGKNPLIVLEDADLDLAARNAAWGAWLHQGQICMATGLILAHESIAQALIQKLVDKAQALTVGNAAREEAALGPLINQRQLQRVHDIVNDSVRAGARLETGGNYDRLFYQPTVLSGVKPGMRAFEDEVFGPVASVVSFASDEEAIELANRSEYGLSAAVISPSVGRAMAIGERLHCGMLHINDQTVADECINPFGGRGASGNGGSVGGPADWDEYTQWQWVTVKGTAPVYPF